MVTKLTKAQEKRIGKIQDELLDKIDEYFPKIKPEGRNKGRGEAAVLVGIALARFRKLLANELSRQKKEQNRIQNSGRKLFQEGKKQAKKELLKELSLCTECYVRNH